MSWFKRDKPGAQPAAKQENGEKRVRTEGLWQKCEGCRQIIWKKDLEANWHTGPKCSHHFRVDARTRLKLLFDSVYETHDDFLASSDPLSFVDSKPYRQRLDAMRESTGLSDALITATGKLDGRKVQ